MRGFLRCCFDLYSPPPSLFLVELLNYLFRVVPVQTGCFQVPGALVRERKNHTEVAKY